MLITFLLSSAFCILLFICFHPRTQGSYNLQAGRGRMDPHLLELDNGQASTESSEHFPVSEYQPVPRPQRLLSRVQYRFKRESQQKKAPRESRRDAIKHAFRRCWEAYREYAWMKDELLPALGGNKITFGAWSATLVDSLDTHGLWTSRTSSRKL
jgi:hypothetical protein